MVKTFGKLEVGNRFRAAKRYIIMHWGLRKMLAQESSQYLFIHNYIMLLANL